MQYLTRKCVLLLFMRPPHPLFLHPSKCLFLSLVKLRFCRLATNVQMIGFVSEEKRESCFTRRSTAKHLTPAKERKQSSLVFANLFFCPHRRPAFFVYPSLSLQPQSSLSIIPKKQRTCQSFPFQ